MKVKRLLIKNKWIIMCAMLGLNIVLYLRPANAECNRPQQGSWVNRNPNSRSLTRIQLTSDCSDNPLNGPVEIGKAPKQPAAPWGVRIFGKCHPKDCD